MMNRLRWPYDKRFAPVVCVVMACCGTPVWAVSTLNTEATVFSEVSHEVSEADDDRNALGVGTSGGYSYNYQVGPHFLSSAHILRIIGEYSESFSERARVTGVASYRYGNDDDRFTFNARHLVQSANIGPGFVLNPAEFEILQIASVGAGFQNPIGDLTRVSYDVQLSGTFYEDSRLNGTNLTNTLSVDRRMNNTDFLAASLSRVMIREGTPTQESEIDTGQVTYTKQRSNGQWNLSIGRTEANTERSNITTTSGGLRRIWAFTESSVSLGYRREVTNTLIDLSDSGAELPPEVVDDPETDKIRLNTLALSDQVDMEFETARPCQRCRFSVSGLAQQQENIDTDLLGYSFQASTNLSVDIYSDQTLQLDYQWRADSEDDPDNVYLEVNRLAVNWNRYLTAGTVLRAEAIQVWLDEEGVDSQRFTARLSVTMLWGPGPN